MRPEDRLEWTNLSVCPWKLERSPNWADANGDRGERIWRLVLEPFSPPPSARRSTWPPGTSTHSALDESRTTSPGWRLGETNPATHSCRSRRRNVGHFRFQKRIGGKFFRVNLSKRGISTTTGVPGAHLNLPVLSRRKRAPMITLGMPGTGLSYRQQIGGGQGRRRSQQQPQPSIESSNLVVIGFVIMVILWFFFGHG